MGPRQGPESWPVRACAEYIVRAGSPFPRYRIVRESGVATGPRADSVKAAPPPRAAGTAFPAQASSTPRSPRAPMANAQVKRRAGGDGRMAESGIACAVRPVVNRAARRGGSSCSSTGTSIEPAQGPSMAESPSGKAPPPRALSQRARRHGSRGKS